MKGSNDIHRVCKSSHTSIYLQKTRKLYIRFSRNVPLYRSFNVSDISDAAFIFHKTRNAPHQQRHSVVIASALVKVRYDLNFTRTERTLLDQIGKHQSDLHWKIIQHT